MIWNHLWINVTVYTDVIRGIIVGLLFTTICLILFFRWMFR